MKYFEHKNYKLTKQENKVLESINKYPKDFTKLSISSFSEKYDLNISGISRTAKKLGMKNVNELKLTLKEKMVVISHDAKVYKKNNSNIQNNVYSHYRNAIEFNVNKITSNKIKKIIKDIKETKNIFIFGYGNSYFAAKNLEISMARLGYKVMLNFGDWFSKDIFKFLGENDLIIQFTERATSSLTKNIMNSTKKGSIAWIITHNIQVKHKSRIRVLHYDFVDDVEERKTPTSKIAQLIISDSIVDNL